MKTTRKAHFSLNRISRFIACLVALVTWIGATPATLADGLVVEVVYVDVNSTDLETLDVDKNGLMVACTAPIPLPELGNGLEPIRSELPLVLHDPDAAMPFQELPKVILGPGVVSDVAIHPSLAFMISAVGESDLFKHSRLLLIRAHGTTDQLVLPGSADSVKWTPDGELFVVAGEKYDAVDVGTVINRGADLRMQLVKRIGMDEFEPFFEGEEERLGSGLEPEFVTIGPNGLYAYISFQEPSSIGVVDLTTLTVVNVIHLPFGFLTDVSDEGEDPEYSVTGVEPDGFCLTADGRYMIIANETDGDALHLQGISIVDLNDGTMATHSIFDIDPTLLNDTGLASVPKIDPGVEPTPEETAAIRSLPRLDPNNAVTWIRGETPLAAINIERKAKDEDRGSVLFLDMTATLANLETLPAVVERIPVGLHAKARPETMKLSNNNRFLWISLQRDGGTFARFELAP